METGLYYAVDNDEGLIEIDDIDEEPDYSEYFAPEGDTFEYEIGGNQFYTDGTYE